jgi:hypothetical protein
MRTSTSQKAVSAKRTISLIREYTHSSVSISISINTEEADSHDLLCELSRIGIDCS